MRRKSEKLTLYSIRAAGSFPLPWALHARPCQPVVREGSREPQATSPSGSAGHLQLGVSSSPSQLSFGKQSIWGIRCFQSAGLADLHPQHPEAKGNGTPQHPTPDHCFSAFASPLRGPRPPSSGQGAQRHASQSLSQAALWSQASFSP